jgi:hypothetical protein
VLEGLKAIPLQNVHNAKLDSTVSQKTAELTQKRFSKAHSMKFYDDDELNETLIG